MTSKPFCWEAAISGKIGLDDLGGVSLSVIPWREFGPSDFLQDRCASVWIEQKQEDTKGREINMKRIGREVNLGRWGEKEKLNLWINTKAGWAARMNFIPPQECCEVHSMCLLEARRELPGIWMILFHDLFWKWQESHWVPPTFTAIHYPFNAVFWNVLTVSR